MPNLVSLCTFLINNAITLTLMHFYHLKFTAVRYLQAKQVFRCLGIAALAQNRYASVPSLRRCRLGAGVQNLSDVAAFKADVLRPAGTSARTRMRDPPHSGIILRSLLRPSKKRELFSDRAETFGNFGWKSSNLARAETLRCQRSPRLAGLSTASKRCSLIIGLGGCRKRIRTHPV